MEADKIINIFGFWDMDKYIHCYFDGSKEVESMWITIVDKLAEKRQLPTRSDYDKFIKDNTPKYFKP